jgi:(p)ppGpp synthase/HD superfamily hydrolase
MDSNALEQAIQLALDAHRGQLDKAGAPYILHPLRVMLRFYSQDERITAVLHDVIEDSPVTLDELRRSGFSEKIIGALDSLTKRDGESYEQFIERAAANPLARRVKLADLEDNLNLLRLSSLQPHDLDRLGKYREAWARLTRREERGEETDFT